jgi:hypothetical protein
VVDVVVKYPTPVPTNDTNLVSCGGNNPTWETCTKTPESK